MKNPHSYTDHKDSAGTLLLMHSLLAIIVYIVKYGGEDDLSKFLSSGYTGFVSSAIIMQGICILLPVFFVMIHYSIPREIVPGHSRPLGSWLIMSFTIGIPAAIVFTGLNNGAVYIMVKAGLDLPSSSAPSVSVTDGPAAFLVIILLSAMLPGIVEELMFRGIIQGSMEAQGKYIPGIFLSAFAFSIFHADVTFLVAPFLGGLLLGYIRHKTGSVYTAILTHIVMNITILLMNPVLPGFTAEFVSQMPSNAALYASLLAASIASVALIPMLIAFSSIKSGVRRTRSTGFSSPIGIKFFLGILILLGATLFDYFTSG